MFIVNYANILFAEDETARELTARFVSDRLLLRTLGEKPSYYLNLPTGLVGPYEANTALGCALLGNQVFQVKSQDKLVLLGSKQRKTVEEWIGRLYSFRPDLAAQLPILRAMVRRPAYHVHNGVLECLLPGYDFHTGWYVDGQALPFEATSPDYPHLKALFSGVTFATAADRANLYGWLAAAYARTAIREFPILVLDGTQKSVGKTTVAQAICVVLTGKEVPTIAYSNSEDELEKRIGDFAEKSGPNIMLFDNVRARAGKVLTIHSQTLSAAATTGEATGRVLFKGMRPVQFMIPIFTMNEAQVEHDLHDKILRIVLTRPEGAVGELRLDPHPLAYAKQYREAICLELQTILGRVIFDPGFKPAGRMHRFEEIGTIAAGELGTTFDMRTALASDGLYNELEGAMCAAKRAGNEWPVPVLSVIEQIVTHPDAFPELGTLFLQRRAVVDHQRVDVLRGLFLHHNIMHPERPVGFDYEKNTCMPVR